MHRLFRNALERATGESKSVIVVIADVRGFSAFSMRYESPDTAMFIKRVYMKLIDSYFSSASFYKPTGDGLVLTFPFRESTLRKVSQTVIAGCIACHSEFGSVCSGDPMINFEVPGKIGIGVARGTACRLVSGNKTLDYSGRLLNLTSRLTDLARPSGIVVDGAFDISLLTDEQQAIFEEDNSIYLRGIAEDKPTQIYYIPEFTVIPKYNKQPIASKKWKVQTNVKSCSDILKIGSPFRYSLESEPISRDDIEVIITHPKKIGGEFRPEYQGIPKFYAFKYELAMGKPVLWVDFPKLARLLKKEQVEEDMLIIISIGYAEK